jgi:hypothetical protein
MSSVGINIESDNGLQTYEYTDFKKIAKYKQWYALYFDKKSVLVLPSNQLSKEEQEQLNKRVI